MLEAHGWFTLDVEGQILIVQSGGAWNLQQAQIFAEAITAKIRTFPPESTWCRVAVIEKLALGTQEMLRYAKAGIEWEFDNHCMGHFYIVESKISKDLLIDLYEDKSKLRFVDSLDEAMVLARALLA